MATDLCLRVHAWQTSCQSPMDNQHGFQHIYIYVHIFHDAPHHNNNVIIEREGLTKKKKKKMENMDVKKRTIVSVAISSSGAIDLTRLSWAAPSPYWYKMLQKKMGPRWWLEGGGVTHSLVTHLTHWQTNRQSKSIELLRVKFIGLELYWSSTESPHNQQSFECSSVLTKVNSFTSIIVAIE